MAWLKENSLLPCDFVVRRLQSAKRKYIDQNNKLSVISFSFFGWSIKAEFCKDPLEGGQLVGELEIFSLGGRDES